MSMLLLLFWLLMTSQLGDCGLLKPLNDGLLGWDGSHRKDQDFERLAKQNVSSQSDEGSVLIQISARRALIKGFDYDLSGLNSLASQGVHQYVLWPRSSTSSSSSSSGCGDDDDDIAVYKVTPRPSTNGSSGQQCVSYGSVKTARFVFIDKPVGRDLTSEFMMSSKFNEDVDDDVMKELSSSSSSAAAVPSSSSSSSSSKSTSKQDSHMKIIALSYYSDRTPMTSALVFLTCDVFRAEGVLRVVWQSSSGTSVHLELRHICCCPDACSKTSISTGGKNRLVLSNATNRNHNKKDFDDDDDDGAGYDDDDDDDANVKIIIRPTTMILMGDGDDADIIMIGDSHAYIWIIIIVNVAIVIGAIVIAAFCCRRAGFASADGPYNYLPKPWTNQMSIHSSRNSIYQFAANRSMMADANTGDVDDIDFDDRLPLPTNMASSASRDYLTSREQKESQLLNLPEAAQCHMIQGHELDLRQRLGGGVFGDSYMAVWGKRKVAAKRIVVGLHGNQQESVEVKLKWIVQSVTQLAKLRHRNLVTVLGVCVETRRPYIVQEYVEGVCLKNILRDGSGSVLTWKKKLKIGRQVAEGMNFLHSLDPPLLHRDLRCSNVFVDSNNKIKIGDFGFTRMFQTLRNQCEGEKNCFCEKSTSAFPSTIRWTSPEVLKSPRAEEPYGYYFQSTSTIAASAHSSFRSLAEPSSTESLRDVITPACDVYSFGMVMWEMASHVDPFADVPDETEVLKLVVGGYRPDFHPSHSARAIFPTTHYRDLMEMCWDPKPEKRPSFKQILVSFKSMVQISESSAELKTPQVCLENATNYYLKSTLNIQ